MKKRTIILLVLIILLGTFLRYHDISQESLWTDEAITLSEAREEHLGTLVQKVFELELLPFGYHIILNKWIGIFGESEFDLRNISAISGIISILIIFLIGREIFSNTVGLMSALFFATGMLQIVYSQEARPYTLFGLLVLLSTYFLIKSIKKEYPETQNISKFIFIHRYLILYSIITLISLYINYMMVFVIILQSLVFYFNPYRQYIKKWIYYQTLIILAFVPIIPALFGQIDNKYEMWVIALPLFGVPQFLAKLGIFFFLIPIVGVFGLIFVIYIFRNQIIKIRFNPYIFISSLIISGGAYLFLLNHITHPVSIIRHSLFMTLPAYILISKAILLIKNQKVRIAILFAILLINSIALYTYYEETTKAPWREAVDYLDETSETPLILFDRTGSNIILFNYYGGNKYRQLNLTWTDENNKFKKMEEKELFEIISEEQEIWLFSSRNIKTQDHYRNMLDKHFELEESKVFFRLKMFKFVKK